MWSALGLGSSFVFLAMLLSSCARSGQPVAGQGQTHWLQTCEADAECGELACLCGVCTLVCEGVDACTERFGVGALCLAGPAEVCGDGPMGAEPVCQSSTLGLVSPESEPGMQSSMSEPGAPPADSADPADPADRAGPSDGDGPVNLQADCPPYPSVDEAAVAGSACCATSAPLTAIQVRPDGEVRLSDYRLNYDVATNHPDSLSLPALRSVAIDRTDNQQLNMLWRFEEPHAGSSGLSGPGHLTYGVGVPDCEGGYEFYGPGSAPEHTRFPWGLDRNRWMPRRVPVEFDAEATGRDRFSVPFTGSPQAPTIIPFVDPDTLELEWELVVRDLEIDSIDLGTAFEPATCMGRRAGSGWEPSSTYRYYVMPSENHYVENGMPILAGQTASQLLAFGLLASEDRYRLDPLSDERCLPGEPDCPWVKLPGALCPETDAERALFKCHVGWVDNGDGLATRCSATAPTSPRAATASDEGQCCDPLGRDGLPTCNAWVVLHDYVAAAAQIGDMPAEEVMPSCQ